MTWAEFRIRLHGFRREQERETLRLRELAWITYVAPHQDPKKMKKSIEQFWPLRKKSSKKDAERMRARMEQAMQDYLKNKKDGSE